MKNKETGSTDTPNSFNTGAIVRPVYSERTMRCFVVTESELKQIGLASIGITAAFGIGSALFAFGLDIYKDVAMAAEIPASALIVASVVQPLCLFGGIGFWLLSVALFLWRARMVSLIKKESG